MSGSHTAEEEIELIETSCQKLADALEELLAKTKQLENQLTWIRGRLARLLEGSDD